ncbi:MAG: DNA recombination protein RmuC [Ignavibacteriaceae bacterium]|jgi:DNA recombination protein RmuC|nr:DNA recombination protein RmuC [Ignavibacteriaceae bacterium]
MSIITLFLLLGLLIGIIIGWIIKGLIHGKSFVPKVDYDQILSTLEQLKIDIGVFREKNNHLETEISGFKSDTEQLRSRIENLTKENSSLFAENKFQQEKLENQKNELTQIGEAFTNQFKVLADEILEDKSKKFTEINQNNISNLLQPLGKNIDEFKRKVEETYDRESKQRFSLEEKIKDLVELNKKLSDDATNLTKALKGDSKVQGDWGEVILERILEQSGLEKGREFLIQEFIRDDSGNFAQNEEGSKLRPDVTVLFPDNRKVIIDSKVSLTSYERFNSSDNQDESKIHLDNHVKSVRKHIDELSAKNYQDFTLSLDFVLMFIPVEPAFIIAMKADPEIWNYGYSKRVILISPTNLLTVLKMIKDIWRRENQNRNALDIAEKSGALYDKFVGLYEDLIAVGNSIEKSRNSYDEAMKKLKNGSGNLIGRVETLRKLGAKAKKQLPLDSQNTESD